jgi:Rad3-related DNA helicase
VKRVVLSSGTLLPSTPQRLWLRKDDYDWFEVPSMFHPSRRPVYYIPTTRMDNRATEGQKRIWMNRIDEILHSRRDRKSLVQSVSYDRADEIKERESKKRPELAKRMITHRSGETRKAAETFKRSSPPSVLVSPAFVEGADFPDDQLRVIVICKVPFATSTDPLFKARCKRDEMYRFEMAAMKIVQMAYRGMRSERDWLEVFVVDDHFSYMRWKPIWPKSFTAAWKEMERVPPPM